MSLDWHAAITLRSLLWCCSYSKSFTQGIQCKRYRNLQKIMPFILNKRGLSFTWCSCTFCYFISDVDIRCKEFDNGTSLHIAASNLCLEGAKCLVSDFVELKKMSSETEHKGQMASFSKFLLANELFLLANSQMTTVFVMPGWTKRLYVLVW